MIYVWTLVGLTVFGIWLSIALLPWFDVIVRRTNKLYSIGSVTKHDGGWYRVVGIKDREGPFDALFGEKYSDVFLRRLPDAEAAVHEVMDS